MGKGTNFSGQPVLSQVIKLMDRQKINTLASKSGANYYTKHLDGAARLVNKEVLALYYAIGGYISVQSRAARWGSNAIGTISELLQQELPGLRGFSETSIKRMRIFYEAWCSMFENRPLSADDLQNSIIPVGNKGHIEIRPLTTDELPPRYTS